MVTVVPGFQVEGPENDNDWELSVIRDGWPARISPHARALVITHRAREEMFLK
jgi:hypothetical protein